MKKLTFILILLIGVSLNTYCQLTQLVHLKTFPTIRTLTAHPADSVYSWTFYDQGSDFDISIMPTGAPYEISSGFSMAPAIYDSNLNPIQSFKVMGFGMFYELTKKIGDNYIFNSNSAVPGGSGSMTFESEPPLSDTNLGSPFSTTHTLRLNTDGEPTLTMPFHAEWYYPGVVAEHPHPIPHFDFATQASGRAGLSRAAYVNDGSVITTLTMFDDIEFNWQETLEIGNNLWGTVWVKINPLTGNYILTPMLSENGSVISHNLFPSESNEFIYRTGVLRGHNLQISPDGYIWENSAEDSLYHTFLVKENANGEQAWIKELFAYNNTQSDLSSGINLFSSETPSLVELNDNVYLSNYVQIISSVGDSIYFTEIDGTETIHYAPDNLDLGEAFITHASKDVYQLDNQGNAVRKMFQKLPFYNSFDKNFSNSKSTSHLFKVDNLLGFSNTYRSISDTTIYFYNDDFSGPIDSTGVDLPAGKGAYILWLDADLNILETTNIPYSSPYDYQIGLRVSEASVFHADTLLITGVIMNGATTNLDPEGLADNVTYSGINSFAGFYTLPSVLSSQSEIDVPHRDLHIYPNPANAHIILTHDLLAGAKYAVYDITGKRVLNGTFSNRTVATLNVENLNSGMYIIHVANANGQSWAEKFLKR